MDTSIPQNLIQCTFNFDALNAQTFDLPVCGPVEIQNVPQKRCSKCKEFFPATAEYFYRDKSKRDGLKAVCKKHPTNSQNHSKYTRERVAKGLCSKCPKPLSPRSKWWCEDHIEKHRVYSRQARQNNKKLTNYRSKISGHRARVRVMCILGGLICAWCGERDYRVLSIDHINGHDIPKKERAYARRGLTFQDIYDLDSGRKDISQFRVLCMNCQARNEHLRGNRVVYPEVRQAVIESGGWLPEED